MRSRLLAWVVCGLSLAGLTQVIPVPATATPETQKIPFTTTAVSFDVRVGPQDDTTCTVVADLYRPATATAANPAPAVLTSHFFGGWKSDPAQVGLSRALAERGYVVLSYSALGFGGSTCRISLAHPDWDGKAGRQLVSFLGGGRAAKDGTRVDFVRRDTTAHDGKRYPDDPRVGMVGVSYGGGTAFTVAGADPRVDTIVPIITWNELQYSLGPNNVVAPPNASQATPGAFKKTWTDLLLTLGIASGIFGIPVDPGRVADCTNFHPQVCEGRKQMAHDGYPSAATVAYLNSASVSSYLNRIKIPTLLMQGQADSLFNLQEAVSTYQTLKKQGTPVKMVWQPWGHSGGILHPLEGEFNLLTGKLEGNYQGERLTAWFEHYLRDADVSTGPEFAYFRDWVDYNGNSAPAYGSANAFPVRATRTFYLSGQDDLVDTPEQVRAGRESYQNWALGIATSHTETAGVDGLVLPGGLIPPYDTAGTHAAYTSAPLAGNTDVVGSPKLRLQVSSPKAARQQAGDDGDKLVMFVKLFDVAPNGSQRLVHRLSSPVRVPDVSGPFQVTLPGIVHRFARGHRLRLVVAGSDTSYAGNAAVLPVTIATGRDAGQVLELPVVPSS